MTKQVILTGLRANNDLHIGNYFGALLPMIDMAKARADEYEINLFVPDLHSFTTPIDHSKLQEQIRHTLRLFAAAGLPLDNPSVHIYRQSYVPAHSELTWILNCFTAFGELNRMTQFKDRTRLSVEEKKKIGHDYIAGLDRQTKIEIVEMFEQDASMKDKFVDLVNNFIDQEERLRASRSSAGLLDYPVLMAADILLYGARYVPVGEDQTQHLEFTRDIAERMNSRFGELFVVPEAVAKQHEFFGKDQGLRIKDLADPTKKMSKSDDTGKGCIFLSDDPEVAAKKVMSAATDSLGAIDFNYDTQPGISNLLQILALLQGRPLADVIAEHKGRDRYGDFKKEVAEAVKAFLIDFQSRLHEVDEGRLMAKVEQDEILMKERANATLAKAQKAVGLR